MGLIVGTHQSWALATIAIMAKKVFGKVAIFPSEPVETLPMEDAGAEIFHLIQEGDRLDDVVDGGAGIDALGIQDGDVNVRVDLRVTVRQETGVGGLTLQNVENLSTGDGWDHVTGNS